jgi:hypothetical protein
MATTPLRSIPISAAAATLARVNGIADIGAYERQTVDDEIFYSGME